jgi:hypothetical protein
MDDELTAAVWRIRYRILWIKPEPGVLHLEDGLLTFNLADADVMADHELLSLTSADRNSVFRAPLKEVRASFPWIIFPIPYFGVGVKLAVHGETYRLSFMWWKYEGWKASSNYGGGGTSFGPSWEISDKDFKPARATVRQWRAALEQPTKSDR